MIVLQNMGGVAPMLTPASLSDRLAQTAENLVLYKGGVTPLKDVVTVVTPSKSGVKKSIYRFGIGQPETQYWFSWTDDVRVAKGPIASDTTERTYFTGDGTPKKTDLALALQGGTGYPVAAYEMGVPAPDVAATTISSLAAEIQSNNTLRGVLSHNVEYLNKLTTRFPFSVEFSVYRGEVDETSLWTVSYVVSKTSSKYDLTVSSANAEKTIVNITASPNKKGTIKFTAKRDNYADVTATFTYQATDNVEKNDAYRITKSAPVAFRNLESVYSLTTLTFTAQKSTVSTAGVREWVDHSGWFVIYEKKQGLYKEAYISEAQETSKSFSPSNDVQEILVDLCLPNTDGTKADPNKVIHRIVIPVAFYIVRSGDVQEQRAYVYTNVTSWGEESSPSPAVLATRYPGTVIKLTSFDAIPDGMHNIVKRYIYRTITSSSGTNYYWVGECPISAEEFIDDVAPTGVGEALMTLDWDVPPDDLGGLVSLPSGSMCGFSGKQVCFSVPNIPYAWPAKYRMTADYEIVAVAPMGQGVAVLTTGYPYFINIGDPESAQMIRIDEEAPCLSSRSVVVVQGNVMYASPNGLVSLGQSGTDVVTKKMYDRESWQSINPSSLFAVKHDNKYVAFDGNGGFVLDIDGNMTSHKIPATAAYVDPSTDNLYLAIGAYIKKWNGGAPLTAKWRSKLYVMPVPTNFSCFQVKASSYNDLTFNMYVDGLLKYSVAVQSESPLRLPSGFLGRQYEFELVGTDEWYQCAIANSMSELRGI